jgi:hypothetical protein
MTEAGAIILGASVSALVTVLVVVVQHRLQQRHDRQRATAERLAQFGEASYVTYLAVSRLALAPMDSKPDHSDVLTPIRGPLTALILRDDEQLVIAAHAIHRELLRLRDVGEASTWAKHDWWTERSHYSDLVEDFHQRARVHLGARPLGKSLEWGPASRPASLPTPGGLPEPSATGEVGKVALASQETSRSS